MIYGEPIVMKLSVARRPLFLVRKDWAVYMVDEKYMRYGKIVFTPLWKL